MSTSVFINLPVTDLERAKAFHEALGYRIDERYTDEQAACVVVEEGSVHLMLLTRPFFETFTDKTIIDPRTHVQVLNALSLDSREAVDEMLAKGLAAGGSEPVPPQEMEFMYSRDLQDPDGNIFEYFWMDEARAPQGASDAS
ncbi:MULTISPECIES: VOC family protein [unclassified Salinibacterium]|uniref:VOC family protein n=1 Tax=unclassified Salinibacterium TaxID=2632331 RepID=UPI0014218FC7|nr:MULTISPECIES: VOC family protein [unclassified Salinibacterium]